MNEYDNDKSWDKSQEEKQFEVEQKKKKPRQRSTTTSDFFNIFFNFPTIQQAYFRSLYMRRNC